ncbi:MAG TPA: thioredoxin domain-containing protein [Patescibacteria group bacterium]|nr:thioredoxin domain-containing protein [Patescibacteria group bacterium]
MERQPNQQSSKKISKRILQSEHAFGLGILTAVALILVVSLTIGTMIWMKKIQADTATERSKEVTTPTPSDGGPAPVQKVTQVDTQSIRYKKGNGDLTFIEYINLESSFSKRFHTIITAAQQKYDGQIVFAVKHFPLNTLSKSKREAGAAECAGKQEKFFEYIEKIFAITPSDNKLEDAQLFTIADELGLNKETFTNCVNNEEYNEIVTADALEAMGSGATGTPHGVMIENSTGNIIKTFEGALTEEQFSSALDQILDERK